MIVVAGAGSGKTRVLVERYLALLDAHPDWPLSVLAAITFTKKAAGEMRDRVRQALEDRLATATIPAEINRWTTLLTQIDGARIDTMHGFCANLLRANAAEAGIDPEFVVLDEIDATILRDDVVDTLLAELATSGGDELELFADYAPGDIHAVLTNPDLLTADLDDLPEDLFEYWAMLWQLGIYDQAALFLSRAVSGGTFTPAQNDRLGDSWQICLDWLDRIVDILKTERGLARLTPTASELASVVDRLYYALQEIAAIELRGGSAKNWGDKEIFDAAKSTLKEIRDAAKTTLKAIGEPPGAIDRRAAELLPLWLSLLQQARSAYQSTKQDQGVLDFNDLELFTRDLLTLNPRLRRRYRAEFKHLLVDEFQDTNNAQWQIVQALADLDHPGTLFMVGDPKQSIYAFRGADVSVFDRARIQIEQSGGLSLPLSISFRTHQPLIDCFNRLFGQLLVRDETSPAAAYQVILGEPLRAHRQSPPEEHKPSIELLLIDQYAYDTDGHISANADGEEQKLSAEERRRWEAHAIAEHLQEMTDAGWLIYDKTRRIHRPVEYGDMAILFQSMSHVTLYEEVFKARQLPYITVKGRGYYSRQEVWDLLNLLQAVYNPADDLALAAVLRSPIFGLSDDALLALRSLTPQPPLPQGEGESTPPGGRDLSRPYRSVDGEGEDTTPDGRDVSRPYESANGNAETPSARSREPIPLWDALSQPGDLLQADEYERVRRARECLHRLRGMAGRVTIAELLREALDQTGYLAILTGLPDGARRRGNVEKLLEKAHSTGHTTLGAFSQYLRDLSAREIHEGEAPVNVAGAVSLLTVHAAKGLEFPVVALADASWERSSGGRDLVVLDDRGHIAAKVYDSEADKLVTPFVYRRIEQFNRQREEAERLRLLYVAATRAQDYLIISGQIHQDNKTGVWKSKGWLDDLLDGFDLRDRLDVVTSPPLRFSPRLRGELAGGERGPGGEEGEMRVHIPRQLPPELTAPAGVAASTGWDEIPSTAAPEMPPLLRKLTLRPGEQARHLAATDIADLGCAEYAERDYERAIYRERFRRQVFHDAPSQIEPIPPRSANPSARQIGEIVHESLRNWRLPGITAETALLDMLRSYAWRLGITDPAKNDDAATRAYRLLEQFRQSDVFRWLETAQSVYRELPFIFTYQGYVIHGVIDALFQVPDGRWALLDYKTSRVADESPAGFARHARQYHLQLGIYASAALEQLGALPETYLHYLRHNATVKIGADERRAALARSLSERIQGCISG